MKKRSVLRIALLGSALAVVITSVTSWVYAGGPLFTLVGSNGQSFAVTWPQPTNHGASLLPLNGGPLNLADVLADGTVVYRVDQGTLGPLSQTQFVAIVDHIFGQYSAIPTSTLRLMDGGPIIDINTGQPVDINQKNVGLVLGATPSGNNAIIGDGNGKIIGDDLVLGEFGLLNLDQTTGCQTEGFVMLNGKSLTKNIVSTTSFIGVFQHEFGHFCGPMDHEQSNGIIADGTLPVANFEDPGAAYDLFAPFTETLYSFIYPAPNDSVLGSQFPDDGYFIATLDMDSQNSLSNLYPTPAYLSSNGSIAGEVIIAGASGSGPIQIPLEGINVIARQMPPGAAYPPVPGTLAFPTAPTFDSFGIPTEPSFQSATAALSIVSSAVSGAPYGIGSYKISGLPPGQYLVEIQDLNPSALHGSSIGQYAQTASNQLFFNDIEEFYNGSVSSASSSTFLPVTVNAGETTQNINMFINGLSTTLQSVSQVSGNNTKKTAQPIPFPVELTGSVSLGDSSQLQVSLGGGAFEAVQNLYAITVPTTENLFFTLDGVDTAGANFESTDDIDLFVWDSGVNKKKTSLSDSHLVGFSAGPTPHEAIGLAQFTPGTYYIGVACSTGSQPAYKLRIFVQQ
jgi:hypothetical protein